MRIRTAILFLAFGLAATGCDLDLENPNAVTETEVVTDESGMVSLAVGMQAQYTSSMDDFVLAPALATDEWGTNTQALVSYRSLLTGESFDDSYAVVEAPFAATYRVVRSANTMLDNLPNLDTDEGTRTGLGAIAKLFKAMAFGTAIQQYKEVPIDVSVDDPAPQPRDVVLEEVLRLLESARSDLQNLSEEDLSVVRSRVLPEAFDLRNTVDAMTARYALMAGRYQAAIDAAERVDLGVLSQFTFENPNVNPIWNISSNSLYVAALTSFVDEAAGNDGRVDYWVDTGAARFFGNPDTLELLPFNRYSGANEPLPVYLPDEMRLIRAEAHARLGELGTAVDLINEVRTQASSPVDEPVADMNPIDPAQYDTEDEVLAQIAYERRYELYMQGLRWEDVRRLGAARTTEPTFEFLPLPRQECLTNPAVNCSS